MHPARRHALAALLASLVTGCGQSHHDEPDAGGARTDGGSTDSARSDGAPPEAPRPATSWEPPFALEVESADPFCHPYPGRLDGVELWADARGVFVVADVRNNDATPYSSWPSGVVVQHHDGEEWHMWYQREHPDDGRASTGLTGVDGGPVWIWQGPCRLRRLDAPGETSCAHDGGPHADRYELIDVHMVEPGRGWHIEGNVDAPSGRVSMILDGDWDSRAGGGMSSKPVEVWGDRAGAWAIGVDEVWGRADAPYGQYTALWVNHRDDVWVASRDGRLLRFDSERWNVREAAGLDLRYLGGTAERMYFASPRSFGAWTPDAGSRVLHSWDRRSLTVRDLYPAREPGAVFLAIEDREHEDHECGSLFVVRFEEGRLERL